MKILKGCFIFLWGIGSILIFFPLKALAFCPLCAIAAGAGVGFFRWLGFDDTIVGLWLGGFIVSMAILLNNFLIKKEKRILHQLPLILFGFYALAILFLYWAGFFVPYNKIFGVYKVIFGIILGSLLLFSVPYSDKFLRKQNQGKIFISHQKVLVAVVLLIIFSFILYFILK